MPPRHGQRLAAQLACRDVSIDLLVNNAGSGMRREFHNLSPVRQLEMLRLNNEAVVELTYSLLPAMLRRPQKGIINVSSTAGFQPVPFASVQSATKAFVTTFSLALEQEPLGAGMTVCPKTRKESEWRFQAPRLGKMDRRLSEYGNRCPRRTPN